MNSIFRKTSVTIAVATVLSVSGVASVNAQTAEDLQRRAAELDQREAALNARAGAASGDLLPPSANPGECYARVWVDAQYQTLTEQVLASEESSSITIIPAEYTTVSETIEVSAASSRLETIPAVYGTESETILVRDGVRAWKIGLSDNDAPASEALMAAARAHGIDTAGASPGMCFHEHYTPASYRTETEQVVTRAASERVEVIPAEYRTVSKEVLVSEASSRLETIPAVFETVSEQVIDKPAHTVWKRGTGPIQRIDEATGEIMCLVEVPATYRTVTRSQLVTPAQTRTVDIPAQYKTVQVQELVSAASERRIPIPAEYGSVSRTVLDQDGGFVWHEVSNDDYPASTRTGNQICLTETQPEYRTVQRQVVQTPAQTRTVDIPAQYSTVEVTKLVRPASEQVNVIPATYRTIEKQQLIKDGYMAWRSILCDTNMTASRISDIQRSLVNNGYDIGPGGVDGVIGSTTIQAVNAFQRDNNLPVDEYLNIETVKALGVSVQ